MARRGTRRGRAWLGPAGRGRAGQGLSEAWNTARRGEAGLGVARSGKARFKGGHTK